MFETVPAEECQLQVQFIRIFCFKRLAYQDIGLFFVILGATMSGMPGQVPKVLFSFLWAIVNEQAILHSLFWVFSNRLMSLYIYVYFSIGCYRNHYDSLGEVVRE